MSRNPGLPFILDDFKTEMSNYVVNFPAVMECYNHLKDRRTVKGDHETAWLLKAVTCLDLTTLGSNDTKSTVERLCTKAAHPISQELIDHSGFNENDEFLKSIKVGAVCVYPTHVAECVNKLRKLGVDIPVASVSAAFPSGQYSLETKVREIEIAVADGAREIDIVVNRSYVACGEWQKLYDEILAMRKACGEAHLKTILAIGEINSMTDIFQASMIAMMAGSDFIKTSTGKESINASLIGGLVMMRAIRLYHSKTGFKVGFKPAGGIRTAKDALNWLILIKEELGNDWLDPKLFRIGASGLLHDIQRQLFHRVTGRYASIQDLSMA